MRKIVFTLAVSLLAFNVTPSYAKCGGKHTNVDDVSRPGQPFFNYFAGPVISSVQVSSVLWGDGVNQEVAASLPGFLNDLVNSPWIDGLAQYNTLGLPAPTTNQVIERGTFNGQFKIKPQNTSKTITDAEIQQELVFQLNAGHLPAPQADASGQPTSLYMIEFPADITIISDVFGTSCDLVNGFCDYNSVMSTQDATFMYAVMPECGKGVGKLDCGSGTLLENQQANYSSALAKAITDPIADFQIYGWLDFSALQGGEISGLCPDPLQGEVVLNGHPYTVLGLWSNAENRCQLLLTPPYILLATDANAAVVAQYIYDINPLPGNDLVNIIESLKAQPNSTSMNNALEQLDPTLFQGILLSNEELTLHVREIISERLEARYNGACCLQDDGCFAVWDDAFGDWAQQQHACHLVGFDRSSYGFIAGGDRVVSRHLVLGASAVYSKSLIDWKEHRGKGTLHSAYGSLYGNWSDEWWYANGVVLGVWNWAKAHRNIEFGKIDRTARHKQQGGGVDVRLDTGLLFAYDSYKIRPFMGVDYLWLHEDGYHEHGADSINLHVDARDASLVRGELGVNLSTCYETERWGKWVPNVLLGWIRDVRFGAKSTKARFEDADFFFTVCDYSPNVSLFRANFSLASYYCHDQLSITLDWNGEFGHKYTDQSGSIAVNWRF